MDTLLAESCADFIKKKIGDFKPETGVVLGSGLGDIFKNSQLITSINYADIPNFPTATVSGHRGRFLFLKIENKNVMVMQGRVHYYEGYTMNQVVMPIVVMKILGVKTLILTNASGGINKEFDAGDLMIITDHISSFVPSPLIGENNNKYGERFPDMNNVYNSKLVDILKETAYENCIAVKQGVYVQATGPNYETPAEVKMFGHLGADAVGMSTVCEAMTANYLGIKVCGISLVTNKAVGLTSQPLNHTEVEKIAGQGAKKLGILIIKSIQKL